MLKEQLLQRLAVRNCCCRVVIMMADGRTEVVLLWETRAMSEQNLLVSAGSAPAGSVPAPNNEGASLSEETHHVPRQVGCSDLRRL
jgi:hypothetical protein